MTEQRTWQEHFDEYLPLFRAEVENEFTDAELREESETDDPWPYTDGSDSDDWKDWT